MTGRLTSVRRKPLESLGIAGAHRAIASRVVTWASLSDRGNHRRSDRGTAQRVCAWRSRRRSCPRRSADM